MEFKYLPLLASGFGTLTGSDGAAETVNIPIGCMFKVGWFGGVGGLSWKASELIDI